MKSYETISPMDRAPHTSTDPVEVVSPFADTQAAVPRREKRNHKLALLIGASVVTLSCISVGVIVVRGYLNDPYRTLEVFPVAKYLDGYRALAGSRFKAEVRVEADLGWKEGNGRLMLFTSSGESRPIAVMVPAALAKDTYFTKGQVYLAELEVKEGGLIYANACKKN